MSHPPQPQQQPAQPQPHSAQPQQPAQPQQQPTAPQFQGPGPQQYQRYPQGQDAQPPQQFPHQQFPQPHFPQPYSPQPHSPQGQLAPAPHAHGRGSLPAGERIPRLGGIIAVLGAALAFASIFLTFIDAPTGALSYQDVATLFGEQAGMPVGLATAMLYAGPVLVVVGVVLAFVSWRLHLAGSIVAGAGASAISFATMNWAIWLTSAGASTGFGIGVWLLLLGFIVTVAGVIGLAFKKF